MDIFAMTVRLPSMTKGFNGAMPFQAWILWGGVGFRLLKVQLQWGHALSGMDMGCCPSRGTDPHLGGFNGAMPFQAWIWSALLALSDPAPGLQWGHALSGMDIPPAGCVFSFPLGLQWGHALSGMDIRQREERLRHPTMASMGPCPFRHGYNA